MPAGAVAQHVVDTIIEATRRGTDAALKAGGALMPPQVHLLLEHADQPYVGHLSCRPFYRGNDVVRAMGMMGVAGFPGTVAALTQEETHHQDPAAPHPLNARKAWPARSGSAGDGSTWA